MAPFMLATESRAVTSALWLDKKERKNVETFIFHM